MIDCRFRPLTAWPGKRTLVRKRSPFKVSWGRCLDDLDRELRHLNARDIIVEVHLKLSQIRNDGWPKSDARPVEPGVIVSFTSRVGPLRYRCDKYTDWQANIRAISLTLQALRDVDRYDCTSDAEQYRGFSALPAQSSATLNAEAAARVLIAHVHGHLDASDASRIAHTMLQSVDTTRGMLRNASRNTHPDSEGGSTEAFQHVQEARRVLQAHHGVTL
jgi:hypothetical protein